MLLNKILVIPVIILSLIVGITSVYATTEPIPEWIKNTAGYWSNDEITDNEFFKLIQFLIDRQIIIIPNTQHDNQKDTQRVLDLQDELSKIKKQTVKDIQNAYDDGYEEGIITSNTNIKDTTLSKYDSCDESRKQNILTGYAALGLRYTAEFIPNNNSIHSNYLETLMNEYLDNIVDELDNYTTNCTETG